MKSLSQLNTFSVETVPYSAQGSTTTQYLPDRYQINGVIDTSQSVMDNLDKIAGAAGSWISYDVTQGKWAVIINTTGNSVASFSDSNIISDITVSGTGLSSFYTGVNVEFPNRDIKDTKDYVVIESPSGDLNPNEVKNILGLNYNIINESVQAQILGLIELKQSRVDLIIKFQTDWSYIGLKAGEIIDVTNSRVGFTNKLFRVISVSESDGNDGTLTLEITALEYNPNVYSLTDLYRYTRSDNDGILAIGSIGKPGLPSVTKYETVARPRIQVTAICPSGIVEGIEYWFTSDTTTQNDSLRSYTLLGTRQPVQNETFTEGDSIVYEWDGLNSGNFYIKVRAVNSTIVGPFSEPSGFVYTPVQTTNAIGPDTGVVSSTGALLTGLAASYLLNQLSGFITGSTTTQAILNSVKQGLGLSTATTSIAGFPAAVAVQEEGSEITTSTSVINFVGSGVTATANGNVVTVTINASTSTGGGGGSTGTTSTNTSTTVTTYLSITNKLPPDRTTFNDPVTGATSDQAPQTGNYYITFAPPGPLYGPLTAGSGSAKLYKSDGTLVQTVSGASLIINNGLVGIPFSTRDSGTDYYILMSTGTVMYCDIESPAIESPTQWNFNTPLYSVSAYNPSVVGLGDPTSIGRPVISSYTPSGGSAERDPTLTITWDREIKKGSGNVKIYDYDSNSLLVSLPVSGATLSSDNQTLTFVAIGGYVQNSQRCYITVDAGAVKSLENVDCYFLGKENAEVTKASGKEFTILASLVLLSVNTDSQPVDANNSLKVNPQSNIILVFNRPVQFGTIGGNFTIHNADGSTYQVFDIETTFEDDKTSEIIWIGGSGQTTSYVYLNPSKDFTVGATYYVTGTSNSVKDFYGNVWGGLSSTSFGRFTVDPGPVATTPPISDSVSTIQMAFDREVEPGPGTIQVLDQNNNLLAEFSSTDPSVTYETYS